MSGCCHDGCGAEATATKTLCVRHYKQGQRERREVVEAKMAAITVTHEGLEDALRSIREHAEGCWHPTLLARCSRITRRMGDPTLPPPGVLDLWDAANMLGVIWAEQAT